eukprot:scaffold14710_cov90-Skeletonema_menzelii.AAC.1
MANNFGVENERSFFGSWRCAPLAFKINDPASHFSLPTTALLVWYSRRFTYEKKHKIDINILYAAAQASC